jgi:xanthine dehydrogenase accessory factor
MNEEVFSAVERALVDGEHVALVTIVRARGSMPQRVGAKMVVYPDGRLVGTIGGGCYESDAFQKARVAIDSGKSELVHYDLNDDFAEESGLICGGQMDVFIEPISPAAPLFVLGAGHVGHEVANLATKVGFKVTVVDDREKFANRERFPDAQDVVVDEIPAWIAAMKFPERAYVVVVTRGHRHDLDAVRGLVAHDLHYVGLIGSRAKVARIFTELDADPEVRDRLRQLHAPIGLDLGAVTPEEIAVAIVAELIAVKYGKARYAADAHREAATASLRWTPGKRG